MLKMIVYTAGLLKKGEASGLATGGPVGTLPREETKGTKHSHSFLRSC